MLDPRPLRDVREGPEGLAGEWLDLVRRSHHWPLDRRVATYWSLRGRALAPAPRPRFRLLAAGAVAAVAVAIAGAAALGQLRGAEPVALSPAPAPAPETVPGWTRLDLGGIGTIEVSASTSFEVEELASERRIRVRTGTLRAEIARQDPERPVVVVSRHLRVVVLGTRFDMHADAERTTVTLIAGRVRVEAESAVVLSSGESITSDDPRLRAPGPAPSAAPAELSARPDGAARRPPRPRATVADCEQQPGNQGRRCLLDLARGDGLAAENALFTLGLRALEDEGDERLALELFTRHAQRFPHGMLAPEVALRRFEVLRRLGDAAAAAAAAKDFEQRFAKDPRAGEVALARAALLCEAGQDRGEAHRTLRRLEGSADASLRGRATAVRARCPPPPPEETEDSGALWGPVLLPMLD